MFQTGRGCSEDFQHFQQSERICVADKTGHDATIQRAGLQAPSAKNIVRNVKSSAWHRGLLEYLVICDKN